jgi:hypothetical protein
MNVSRATSVRAREQVDWPALAAGFQEAAGGDTLEKFRRRRWGEATGAATWLEQEHIPSLSEQQALTLFRAAGGRQVARFRTNPIEEIRDAVDFLLYDTIKLESRFDECASPDGGFGLSGAGREWPSYLLTLRESRLFAPWSPHTERALRRMGLFSPHLKRGHVGLCYLELLDILEYVRARLGLPDLRAVDEFCYLYGIARRPAGPDTSRSTFQ